MTNLEQILRNVGLSEKAACVYIASLKLGEASILDLAKQSGVKRTSIYYTLSELKSLGAITETKRNKKIYYLPENPRALFKRSHENILTAESLIEEFEQIKHSVFKKPRVYFLYGPSGFKQIWDMVFASKDKEFRIITEGKNFLDFVKEKYIIDEIIATKRKLGIKSRQLISSSAYALKIMAKDTDENRVSKLLPADQPLSYTEIICTEFVAYISPRFDNSLFVVENERFADTRKNLFEIMWKSISG